MNAHDLAAAIADLDHRGAGDSEYRTLLSTAGKDRTGFSTWRQKALFVLGSRLVSETRAAGAVPNWRTVAL